MTIETDKQALRELLGADYSEEELERILREVPELAQAKELLHHSLQQARAEMIPELSPDFTTRVMLKLQTPNAWERFREKWFSLPRLVLASAVTAALVLGLWLGGFHHEVGFPGLSVREAMGPERQKIYFVRFAIKDPEAKQVAIAGDFNQWNPATLSLSSNEKGLFTVELPLAAGTYSYAFVINGHRWVADAAADRVVDDGFGQRNSVINL